MSEAATLLILIFLAALLYSSVGHAGASGYLAVMAIMGVEPMVMKPAALALNILVASIATIRYSRVIRPPWRMLGPLVIGSVPLSFVGGAIELPDAIYNRFVGAVLLFAALRSMKADIAAEQQTPPVPAVLLAGASIGFLSGLTGTGGGIFLSPLLLSLGWANMREATGIAAVFVLVNSLAGLAGNLATVQQLPPEIGYWALTAAAGAFLGTELGSRRLSPHGVQMLLAAILAAAGFKLLFSAAT
jgi:uncharacterized membrane protein YfcA